MQSAQVRQDVIAHLKAADKNQAPPIADGEGVVRAVDMAAAEIIIPHGPLTEINMPSMTMAFEVKDASLLERSRPATGWRSGWSC